VFATKELEKKHGLKHIPEAWSYNIESQKKELKELKAFGTKRVPGLMQSGM